MLVFNVTNSNIMTDIKTLLKLTQEAKVKDQPFVDAITTAVSAEIDNAMAVETEYRVEYDINAELVTTDGPLQTTRIQNTILADLKTKGYRAKITTTELSPNDPMLVITWTVATLTKAS